MKTAYWCHVEGGDIVLLGRFGKWLGNTFPQGSLSEALHCGPPREGYLKYEIETSQLI